MFLALALSAQVMTAAPLHLLQASDAPWSARLLAQASALPAGPDNDPVSLQQRIDELNGRIHKVGSPWIFPTFLATLLGLGSGVGLSFGLQAFLTGLKFANGFGVGGQLVGIGLLVVGGVLTGLGALALVGSILSAIAAVGVGLDTSSRRLELIEERDSLEVRLRTVSPPFTLTRPDGLHSLVTVAAF